MEKNIKLEITPGVIGLLANAHSHSDYQGERYYFEGDLCQMFTAQEVATKLGIPTSIEGGLSEQDFKKVTQYLIDHRIEGWLHYVTHEEYCRIKGEYYFGGEYLCWNAKIHEIADELGIFVGETDGEVAYTTSKEDFDTIIKKLDELAK